MAPVAVAPEERRSPASAATGKPEQDSNGSAVMPVSEEHTAADTIKEDKRSESTPIGGPPGPEAEGTTDKKSPLNGGSTGGSPVTAPTAVATPPTVASSQAASGNSSSTNSHNSSSSNVSNKNEQKERDDKGGIGGGDPLGRNGAKNNNGSNGPTVDGTIDSLGKQKQQQNTNGNGTAAPVTTAPTAGKENR